MFKGTVRETKIYNKSRVNDKELENASKTCGIYHFVKTLSNGFDTVLDDSIALSAGQKQLFTIARAMISNNPMLILDKTTSYVDTRTELITQRVMNQLTEHCTSFVIAHPLPTIKNAGLILVLKDGDIIEQGIRSINLCWKKAAFMQIFTIASLKKHHTLSRIFFLQWKT